MITYQTTSYVYGAGTASGGGQGVHPSFARPDAANGLYVVPNISSSRRERARRLCRGVEGGGGDRECWAVNFFSPPLDEPVDDLGMMGPIRPRTGGQVRLQPGVWSWRLRLAATPNQLREPSTF